MPARIIKKSSTFRANTAASKSKIVAKSSKLASKKVGSAKSDGPVENPRFLPLSNQADPCHSRASHFEKVDLQQPHDGLVRFETYTALITPFKNNKIDEVALKKLIEFQIAGGVDGVVPCGTTGESPTLSHEEHNLVIEIAVKTAKKRVQVMAGTGSNSTAEAVSLTKGAKKLGVDSCLIVAPYYNKPTAEGIYQHFYELNKIGVPLVIYNIPGRSVINISDEILAKIAKLENVVGIKDATGDLARVASLRLLINKKFKFLSGEDATAVGFNAMGGNGIISVSSNIAPKMVADLQKACALGDYKTALSLQDKLTNLHAAMFCETNPIPVKYAASLMGLCSSEIRLPLTAPSEAAKKRIVSEMQKLGLIT